MDLNNLAKAAQGRIDKAWDILGACPGPGIDIWIKPTNPISDHWQVEHKTECGKRWLKHQGYTGLVSNAELAKLKQEAGNWGLSFHTDWSCVISEME